MRVIDASVLIKYVTREEGWTRARRVIEEGAATVELALKELANALWKKARRGEVDAEHVGEILLASRSVVKLIDQGPILEDALRIAIEHGVTVYDALYIAAALKGRTSLATCDRGQARVAEALGISVELL